MIRHSVLQRTATAFFPRIPKRYVVLSLVAAILTCPAERSLLLGALPPPPETAIIPFELRPYQVRISLAWQDSADVNESLKKRLQAELPAVVDRYLAASWNVSVEDNTWMLPASRECLSRLTIGTLPETWRSEGEDKSFVVLIELQGTECRLTGREWDAISHTLGEPMSLQLAQHRGLAEEIFRLIHQLFRARLSVDWVSENEAGVTVQAGALPPADPTFTLLKKDQFWQPFVRMRNAKNEVEKRQLVPWTYLQIESLADQNPEHGQARIVSGLRVAIPKRRGPRIDVLAFALHSRSPYTDLQLVSRAAPFRPLVGVAIDVKSPPDGPPLRLMTDRRGITRLKSSPQTPLVWATVRSGEKIMARLPVLPGVDALVVAEIPDDSIRLRVEGELSILESHLTDTVAQRAVLMARIRRHVQLGEWSQVTPLRKELGLLSGTSYYLQELNAIRIPAIQAANKNKDKVTIANVERVCGEASRTIQKFLDDDKLKAFDEELRELEKQEKTKKSDP